MIIKLYPQYEAVLSAHAARCNRRQIVAIIPVLDMQVVEARALTIGAYVHLALDNNRHTAGRFRVIAITERTVTIDYPPTRCQMTRLRSQVVRAA